MVSKSIDDDVSYTDAAATLKLKCKKTKRAAYAALSGMGLPGLPYVLRELTLQPFFWSNVARLGFLPWDLATK